MRKEDRAGSLTVMGQREHLNPLAAVDMIDRSDHGAGKETARSEWLISHFKMPTTLFPTYNDCIIK